MAAHRRVVDLVTSGLTTCSPSVHRDQLKAQRSVTSMESLLVYTICTSTYNLTHYNIHGVQSRQYERTNERD